LGLRLHDLRHAAVALWIAAGAGPKQVATRAGHTSVSFTLDRDGTYTRRPTPRCDRLDALYGTDVASAEATVVLLPRRARRGPARPRNG
jgi:hypothetical protein